MRHTASLCIAFALFAVPAVATAAPQGGLDIHMLLDTSGSMRGRCGSTCQNCSKDGDECPAGHHCAANGLCRLTDNAACRDIWARTVTQAVEYVSTLRDGSRITFYVFDRDGSRAQEIRLSSKVVNEKVRQELIGKIRRITPNARCTRLYDMLVPLAKRLHKSPVPDGLRRLLWVFTDGDDDGSSRHTADELAEFLKCGTKSRFMWQLVRPKGALKDFCDKHGNSPCCPPAVDTKAAARPELTFAVGKLSVTEREASASMSLLIDSRGLFPFEVAATFKPASEDDARFVDVPAALNLNSTSARDGKIEGTLNWRFHPNLAVRRPKEIKGTITLDVTSGTVDLAQNSVDVTIPVAGARIAGTYVTGSFSKPPKQVVKAKVPAKTWQTLSQMRGFDKLAFAPLKPKIVKGRKLKGLRVAASAKAFKKAGEIRLQVEAKEPRSTRRKGDIVVALYDQNRWIHLGQAKVPLAIGEQGGVEKNEDDDPMAWIIPLLVLAVLAGLYFALRKPDVSGITLSVGSGREVRLLDNGPLRLRWPPPRKFALKELANEDELADPAMPPARDRSDIPAPPDGLSGLRNKQVEVSVDADGHVVLKADAEVFRLGKGDARDEYADTVPLATARRGIVRTTRRFVVLRNGPEIDVQVPGKS